MPKAPSTNIQAPEKLQEPNIKCVARRPFEYWSLGFLWSLVLGIWSFESDSACAARDDTLNEQCKVPQRCVRA